MPRMPKTLCAKCNQIAAKGNRCAKHPPAKQPHGWNHTESRHKRGYGTAWYKLRARILRRDDNLCQPCKQAGLYREAKQVDHIINKAQGGTDEEHNLQSICISCHKYKTQQESHTKRVKP